MICSISGIRLPQSALTTVVLNETQYKVCTHLLRHWVLFAGQMYWDGTPLDDLNFGTPGTHGPQSKALFFQTEFTNVLDTVLFNEDLDNISALTYVKVLLGSLLRFDATLAGILAHETYLCVNLLLSEPTFELPGHRMTTLDLLGDLSDLLCATFVSLVQDDIDTTVSLLNSFGRGLVAVALL